MSERPSAHTGRSQARRSQPSRNHAAYRQATHQTTRSHAAYSQPARKSRKTPVLAIIIVLAIVIAIVALGIFALKSCTNSPSDDAASTLPITQKDTVISEEVMAEDVVMTLGGSRNTYVLKGEEYLEAGCHAVDPDAQNSPDITSTVQISGNVDTSVPGTYTVTYTAKTENGQVAVAERTVHVVESFESGNAASIPVFMYHYLYNPAAPPDDMNNNLLSITDLEAHLQYLTENNYYYPSYQEIRAFAEGNHTLPANSATLTFDDGEWNVYTLGGELFRKYEVPATMFLICKDENIPERIVSQANPYISFQSHTYGMHTGGSGIGRGGLIHASSQQEIYDDIVKAQEILGTTEAVAYPFGDNNETAWAALEQANVQCAFTIENRRIKPGDNPMALPRVRISNGYGKNAFSALAAADPVG
ncbi:immunoglobulin-like domain-containing protein [Adlercreutzia sp. ZJ154]|uniref:immunoglobulin-like domain-containing protein n=1 Tax=Adlercreutzia sp. ZJ154 TaxID=2709790 RepID=UPI0013ED5DEF|nr:immunoglobulin-like domain-containing protein [Adlercreutzia sp. ZJ154]